MQRSSPKLLFIVPQPSGLVAKVFDGPNVGRKGETAKGRKASDAPTTFIILRVSMPTFSISAAMTAAWQHGIDRLAEGRANGARRPRRISLWQRLGTFLPGRQVVFLFLGELVEFVAHGFELETGDFLVEIFGHDVHLRLESLVVGA